MAQGYYKKIKGINYDRKLIEFAELATKGKGDGRISLTDAKKLLKLAKDAGTYTDVEKRTMRYIRDSFKFTPESNRWFRTEIRKWAVGKVKTPKGVSKKKGTSIKKSRVVKKKSLPKKRKTRIAERETVPIVKTEPTVEKTLPEPETGKKKKPLIKIILFFCVISILIALSYLYCPGVKKYLASRCEKTDTVIKGTAETEEPVITEDENFYYYTVKKKDQLTEISKKYYGNFIGWKIIFQANRNVIEDPHLIITGQRLKVPKKKK